MLALFLFASVFYSYGFWTTDLEALKLPRNSSDQQALEERACMTIEKWLNLLNLLAIFDTIFTMALPFVLILTLNSLIMIKLTRNNNLTVKTTGSKQLKRQSSSNADVRSIYRGSTLGSTISDLNKKPSVRRGKLRASRTERNRLVKETDALPENGVRQENDEGVVKATDSVSDDLKAKFPRSHEAAGEDSNSVSDQNPKTWIAKSRFSVARLASITWDRKKSRLGSLAPNPRYTSYESRVIRLSSCYIGNRPRARRYSKTTRMLLIISTTFLILHGPTAMLKTWYILTHYAMIASQADSSVSSNTTGSQQVAYTSDHSFSKSPSITEHLNSNPMQARPVEELLERITCYLYYLHFSLNFFLYVFNIRVFRQFFTRNLTKKPRRNSF